MSSWNSNETPDLDGLLDRLRTQGAKAVVAELERIGRSAWQDPVRGGFSEAGPGNRRTRTLGLQARWIELLVRSGEGTGHPLMGAWALRTAGFACGTWSPAAPPVTASTESVSGDRDLWSRKALVRELGDVAGPVLADLWGIGDDASGHPSTEADWDPVAERYGLPTHSLAPLVREGARRLARARPWVPLTPAERAPPASEWGAFLRSLSLLVTAGLEPERWTSFARRVSDALWAQSLATASVEQGPLAVADWSWFAATGEAWAWQRARLRLAGRPIGAPAESDEARVRRSITALTGEGTPRRHPDKFDEVLCCVTRTSSEAGSELLTSVRQRVSLEVDVIPLRDGPRPEGLGHPLLGSGDTPEVIVFRAGRCVSRGTSASSVIPWMEGLS